MNFRASRAVIALIWVVFFQVLVIGCGKDEITPEESPEEVVKKFYAYIKEGGNTTLGEAYKLISKKHYVLDEDIFKNLVSKYPKDMEVKIIGSSIMKDKAVVTIEYRTASSFGGYFTTQTDINLELDEESMSWKIDFTGETYDENPYMYTS